jgi:TPR repeat protein
MDNYDSVLYEADIAISEGNAKKAHILLSPLVEREVPEAIYLSSRIPKPRESIESFEIRRFYLLHKAARLGHAESIYIIGVMYDVGDGVLKNSTIASCFFEQAAILGHSRAKLSYGLDLFRGQNRIQKDTKKGIEYISQSALDNVEGANEILKKIENNYYNM